MRARGAMPEIETVSPFGRTASTTLPAAVLAVCDPWPSQSRADSQSPEKLISKLLNPSLKNWALTILFVQSSWDHCSPDLHLPVNSAGTGP